MCSVSELVQRKIDRINYFANPDSEEKNPAYVKRILAELRIGLTRDDMLSGLEFLLQDLSYDFIQNHEEEIAIAYDILMLFAKHQQSRDVFLDCADSEIQNFGRAFRLSNDNNKNINDRFMILISSAKRNELILRLKSLISVLSKQSFCYKSFAQNIYLYDYPEYRNEIRMLWGKDYYRQIETDDENESEE
jgi:CRISPR type I-E-associated protein CasB/Cse2